MAKTKAKRDEFGLLPKERAFADLYRAGPDDVRGNSTQCYVAVHPRCKENSAKVQASRMLNSPNVSAYLEMKRAEATAKADVNEADILSQLARLGFADVRKMVDKNGNLLPIHELDDDIAAAIDSVEVVTRHQPGGDRENPEIEYVHKYRLTNKVKPLELLGKHLQMFVERTETKVTGLESLIDVLKQASGTPESHPMERIRQKRDAGQ